jgi:FimV-like protein
LNICNLKSTGKLLAALALFLLPTFTLAVSLGDELILSRLGDPVEVEIEVLQWEDIDLERVQITAATREEYAVFDLTWLPVLDELSFNLVGPDLDGDVRVLISSREALNEPFLELLLVLRWPGGSLRREYVLLFDPPGPTLTVTAPVSEPVVMTVPQLPPPEEPAPAPAEPAGQVVALVVEEAPVIRPPPAATEPLAPEPPAPSEPEVSAPAPVTVEAAAEIPADTVATAAPDPEIPDARTQIAIEVETVAPAPPAVLDTERRTYQIRSGDGLWNIARQFRPAGAGENLYQMLLSLHNLNRSAFINGNISLLKANAMLQIPNAADINAVDSLTAEAEFNRRWEAGTARFEAAQRGEAIPLFANAAPPEAVVEVEEELPPGMEAPVAEEGDGALIMVSETNVPQPLQIADAAETVMTTPAATVVTVETAVVPAVANPPEPAVASEPAPVQTQLVTVARAALAAELEAEVAAMQARRESAEALAQQLQDSLQRAQAERAAAASFFSPQNLLLAVSAGVLLAALVAAVVFSLKVAGELRLRHHPLAAVAPGAGTAWLARTAVAPDEMRRREPHMPEMEVVELPAASEAGPVRVATRQGAQNPDDLFALMEDLLETDTKSPKK